LLYRLFLFILLCFKRSPLHDPPPPHCRHLPFFFFVHSVARTEFPTLCLPRFFSGLFCRFYSIPVSPLSPSPSLGLFPRLPCTFGQAAFFPICHPFLPLVLVNYCLSFPAPFVSFFFIFAVGTADPCVCCFRLPFFSVFVDKLSQLPAACLNHFTRFSYPSLPGCLHPIFTPFHLTTALCVFRLGHSPSLTPLVLCSPTPTRDSTQGYPLGRRAFF